MGAVHLINPVAKVILRKIANTQSCSESNDKNFILINNNLTCENFPEVSVVVLDIMPKGALQISDAHSGAVYNSGIANNYSNCHAELEIYKGNSVNIVYDNTLYTLNASSEDNLSINSLYKFFTICHNTKVFFTDLHNNNVINYDTISFVKEFAELDKDAANMFLAANTNISIDYDGIVSMVNENYFLFNGVVKLCQSDEYSAVTEVLGNQDLFKYIGSFVNHNDEVNVAGEEVDASEATN